MSISVPPYRWHKQYAVFYLCTYPDLYRLYFPRGPVKKVTHENNHRHTRHFPLFRTGNKRNVLPAPRIPIRLCSYRTRHHPRRLANPRNQRRKQFSHRPPRRSHRHAPTRSPGIIPPPTWSKTPAYTVTTSCPEASSAPSPWKWALKLSFGSNRTRCHLCHPYALTK